MAPTARKRKGKSKKPPLTDPFAVYDFASEESDELSVIRVVPPGVVSPTPSQRMPSPGRVLALPAPESAGAEQLHDSAVREAQAQGDILPEPGSPKENRPEKQGQKRTFAETVEDDLGDEVEKILEAFGAEMKQALLARRKKFEMNTKASIKATNEKLERVWKIQQEKRQTLHHRYSQQFLALFHEWDLDMQKVQEQEEKLADMFREQRRSLQQARFVQNQRLKKVKNLYEKFLKNMEDLEKAHEHLFADGYREVRQDLALLRNNILVEAQQQELAAIQKSLQTLLF